MDLTIDFHDLGRCWIEQVEMSFKIGQEVVSLELEKNQLKDRIERVKAEIDLNIRLSNDKKPTEAAINSMIVSDPEYQNALAAYYLVDGQYREAKNKYNTLETRRKALESLTQLYVAGYFSSKNIEVPDIAKNQIQEEQHEELNKGTTKKRLRNVRKQDD